MPGSSVNIRFNSTLTSEDENRIAPAILKAVTDILDVLPVAYMVRIETVDSHVYRMVGPTTLSNASSIHLVPREAAKTDSAKTDAS